MTDTPESAPVQSSEGQSADRDPLPSPEELNAAMIDGSGNAVSSQPFDTDVADFEDARHRVTWDADTDGRAPTKAGGQ